MLPYLDILGRRFPTYSIIGLLGLCLAVLVARRRLKRYAFALDDALFIAAFAGLGLLAGGVLLHAITQIPDMWRNRELLFSDFFPFMRRYFGGMVFYGGLFGAIGGLLFYARFMNVPGAKVVAFALPVFPLAHAVMRVGCFAGGCCYGIPAPPPWGIAFTNALAAPNHVPLLPVQLYESAANLAIFAGLWGFTKKDRDWIHILCFYGLAYSAARFGLEFLRGDPIRGFFFGLSTSQWISIAVFALGLFALLYRRKRPQKEVSEKPEGEFPA